MLSLADGHVREIAGQLEGGVCDRYDLSFDAKRVVFGYRRPKLEGYRIYEIDIDGTNLHQLTDGPDNDIEPIYAPDGSIVFCSSRCHRYVPCWKTQVATLYRCNADGSGSRWAIRKDWAQCL